MMPGCCMRAISSGGEHYLDTVGVRGSNPLSPSNIRGFLTKNPHKCRTPQGVGHSGCPQNRPWGNRLQSPQYFTKVLHDKTTATAFPYLYRIIGTTAGKFVLHGRGAPHVWKRFLREALQYREHHGALSLPACWHGIKFLRFQVSHLT
jgi:hypothetical protein